MRLDVKICGIRTPEVIDAAVRHGARYIGLNFYPASPRSVEPQVAAELARRLPTGVRSVGLFVDPGDAMLDAIVPRVPLDMLQLHGRETPQRVREIRDRFGSPVMKALGIGAAEDLAVADDYEGAADRLLFDARPPKNVTALPGGNGIAFDWKILAGRRWRLPWMLSGGLNAGNLAEAVMVTGAASVDTASGVEDRPGHKTPERVAAFLVAASAIP
jgi:phosphoribosylanthranilate isomerase